MEASTIGTIFSLILLIVTVLAQKCGQKQVVINEQSFDGHKAQTGAWPWHGAMFHRERSAGSSDGWYVCGVTILSEQFVITAGNCTLDPNNGWQPIPESKLFIQVGVTKLDAWNKRAQEHNVARIIRNDENNVALMKLYTDVTFNEYVQPICLWQGDPSLREVVSQIGFVVGWRNNGDSSLREATMPIVYQKECIESDPKVYFEPKTFCAGHRNGSTVTQGFSGSGLVFRVGNTWTLRGIVSYTRQDPKNFVVFTNVSNYESWIKRHVMIPSEYTFEAKQIVKPEANPTVINSRPASSNLKVKTKHTNPPKCGQKKPAIEKLIFNGYKAQPGAWPWHGALFHRNKDSATRYACGVTILTEKFVITVTHCTLDPDERQRMPVERVFVKVGLTNLNAPEPHVQQHDVIKIYRHEEYDEEVFENDIALMKLHTEITFTNFVQPICLWQGDTNLKHVVSKIGYTVGWGYQKYYSLPKDLNEATLPIVSRTDCIRSDPNYYRKFYIEPKTFCAGHRNGTTAAPGDSGSGLYLQHGNSWVLRGMISNTKSDPNKNKVNANSFVILVDVTYYLGWIKAALRSAN